MIFNSLFSEYSNISVPSGIIFNSDAYENKVKIANKEICVKKSAK
jgi:hypothetical protein